jgi:hypothetical protein
VLRLVEDHRAVLRACLGILKPGGGLRLLERFFSTRILRPGVQKVLGTLWHRIAGGCHLRRSHAEALARPGRGDFPGARRAGACRLVPPRRRVWSSPVEGQLRGVPDELLAREAGALLGQAPKRAGNDLKWHFSHQLHPLWSVEGEGEAVLGPDVLLVTGHVGH